MRKAKRRNASRKQRIIVLNPHRKHKRRKARKSLFGNPRRRRYHRNPKIMARLKGLTSKKSIMSLVSYGAGVVGGMLTPSLLAAVLPAQYRKYFGLASIGISALLFSFVKNSNVKNAALVMGGFGAYDLLTQNLTGTGLPTLGNMTEIFGLKLPGATQGLSYQPRHQGLSYTPMSASYGPKFSSMGGATNPYENLMM
jgi:hypothetical protein